MKKALILVYVFILSFSSTVSCEEKDNTVLNGAVSYPLPSSWKVLDKKRADSFNAILLLIPCRDADNTPHRANATIVTEKNKENLTLEQYSNWKLERMNNEKTKLVGDKVDKSTWRWVLWRSEEKNTPYLVFDRFGVTTDTRVYMRIAFPLLKDGDQKWIKICATK